MIVDCELWIVDCLKRNSSRKHDLCLKRGRQSRIAGIQEDSGDEVNVAPASEILPGPINPASASFALAGPRFANAAPLERIHNPQSTIHNSSLLAALALFLLAGCNSPPSKPADPTIAINGRTWPVEIAMTAQQRYSGLSNRLDISDKSGMLFIFHKPRVLEFCMRQCPKPIDVAFINAQRRIVMIHTMQPEADLAGRKPYSSIDVAQWAFETAGGALAAAGVKVGDEVQFSADVPPPEKAEPDR